MLPGQLDLFSGTTAPSTSIVGLTISSTRTCRYCGSDLAVIGSSRNIHAAELLCAACGQHMGWLPGESFSFIAATIDSFGRPESPIIVRASRR
jgi:hypothetical protein